MLQSFQYTFFIQSTNISEFTNHCLFLIIMLFVKRTKNVVSLYCKKINELIDYSLSIIMGWKYADGKKSNTRCFAALFQQDLLG